MVTLIAALSTNRCIGNHGKIPWHIPEDLKHFRDRTKGHPIIMGRKTFETLPKPLPNRTHYIISRSVKETKIENGVYWLSNLEEAIHMAKEAPGGDSEIFVTGGGEIYTMALPIATHLDLTLIHAHFEGDAFFPSWDGYGYEKIKSQPSQHEGIKFDFTLWQHPLRSKPGS